MVIEYYPGQYIEGLQEQILAIPSVIGATQQGDKYLVEFDQTASIVDWYRAHETLLRLSKAARIVKPVVGRCAPDSSAWYVSNHEEKKIMEYFFAFGKRPTPVEIR